MGETWRRVLFDSIEQRCLEQFRVITPNAATAGGEPCGSDFSWNGPPAISTEKFSNRNPEPLANAE
jgi:hypothetical protein